MVGHAGSLDCMVADTAVANIAGTAAADRTLVHLVEAEDIGLDYKPAAAVDTEDLDADTS